jgi:hypothetical protein
MINVSISYGFGPENRYNIENIPTSIQLALYKIHLYKNYREELIKIFQTKDIKIPVVHLPIDGLKEDSHDDLYEIIRTMYQYTNCRKYVIHPNKGIRTFVGGYMQTISPYYDIELSIETFGWKSNKSLRSPLEITEFINSVNNRGRDPLSMTIDTTHIEDVWFDYKIMRHLLKYTSVIHLSNRAKGVGQHLPFNDPRGELELVKFVRELKHQYKWSGDIVLEYMGEYHHKLIKNAGYAERLLQK